MACTTHKTLVVFLHVLVQHVLLHYVTKRWQQFCGQINCEKLLHVCNIEPRSSSKNDISQPGGRKKLGFYIQYPLEHSVTIFWRPPIYVYPAKKIHILKYSDIYLFIYCNWVVTRWQWLFYM